jgi:hypothetical protein
LNVRNSAAPWELEHGVAGAAGVTGGPGQWGTGWRTITVPVHRSRSDAVLALSSPASPNPQWRQLLAKYETKNKPP